MLRLRPLYHRRRKTYAWLRGEPLAMTLSAICASINSVLDCAAIASFNCLEYFVRVVIIEIRSIASIFSRMVYGSVPESRGGPGDGARA